MIRAVLFLAASAVAMPAAAQVTQMESATATPKSSNPNEKICQRIVKTGSRLGSSTVCMTANEWKDVQQGQREDVERRQRQTILPYQQN
jgi:hypothetical protein